MALATRAAIVAKAQSFVGLKEADGSHMRIVNKYNTITPLPMGYKVKKTDSWCAATVSTVFYECGYTAQEFPFECSCPRMIDKAKKMGLWEENDAYVPKMGDVILYDWQDSGKGDNRGAPDHVGIVTSSGNGQFIVIEGNKNDAVGYRTLKVDQIYIRGFVTPKFKAAPKTKTFTVTTKKAVWLRSSHKVSKSNHVRKLPKGTKIKIMATYKGKLYTWGKTSDGYWLCLKNTTYTK